MTPVPVPTAFKFGPENGRMRLKPMKCLSESAMVCRIWRLVWIFLLAECIEAQAAEKIAVRVSNQTISAYRTADLEEAKKEAAAAHKPIAWIASSPQLLDGRGTISLPNSRGATLHAFLALHDRAVLIFMDAYEENHKVPSLMDDALHTPDPHYTPPTVLFLDPEAKRILTSVTYEPDFTKRAHALAKALEEVKGKLQ
jgi:hypothetical protein